MAQNDKLSPDDLAKRGRFAIWRDIEAHPPPDDEARWRRLERYEYTHEDDTTGDLISSHLFIELSLRLLQDGVNPGINVTEVLQTLEEKLQEIEDKLEDWLKAANNSQIAVLYPSRDSNIVNSFFHISYSTKKPPQRRLFGSRNLLPLAHDVRTCLVLLVIAILDEVV